MKSQAQKTSLLQIIPVMLCFFAMGFVDLVGTASNYVQKDLGLSDSEANLFPSLVFFWFLLFSVPTGLLMNKIGRKNTVLISLLVTIISLIIPITGDSYYTMLAAFSLLGIGNAIMQTSLNPLVTNLISGDKLASTLTFGQFVKAIASFLAPILAAWGATTYLPVFGLGWRALFVIYAAVCFISIAILAATPINEEKPDKASGILDCLRLLGRPFIILCFIGIMCLASPSCCFRSSASCATWVSTSAPTQPLQKSSWSNLACRLKMPDLPQAYISSSVLPDASSVQSFCARCRLSYSSP